jgi:hypothetical protein
MRRLLACSLLIAGCSSNASPDAATPDLASPTVQATITATPDLVGFATRLDGSQSSDPQGRALSFAWHFTSVPTGSTVGDAQLSSTSDAMVSFEPDLGGMYTVQLTVTAGADTAMTTGMFTVPTVPLFFQQAAVGAQTTSSVSLIRSDGTGRKVVSCAATVDGGDVMSFGQESYFSTHAFDPPPGGAQPARFAFSLTDGNQFGLYVASENSDCATNAPPRVDQSDPFYSTKPHNLPRFSPDGSRVLFIDNPNSQNQTSRVVTASVDGLNFRVIRGANGSVNLNTAPPLWLDGTHVAWVENTGTNTAPKPVLYTAADQANAGDTPTVLLDCSTTYPILNQFAVLPNGNILLAAGTKQKLQGGSLNLYLVQGPGCTTLTTFDTENAGGEASDFALAPDGNTVIVAATHGQTNDGGIMTHDLFTFTIDGAHPFSFFAGAPGIDDFGPRFVGGGEQVLWTQGSQLGDGAVTGGGLMIANANGSHVRSLVAESSSEVVIGGSNAGLTCAWAGPLAGGSLASLLLLVGVLLVVTRRSGARRGPGPWSR